MQERAEWKQIDSNLDESLKETKKLLEDMPKIGEWNPRRIPQPRRPDLTRRASFLKNSTAFIVPHPTRGYFFAGVDK